MATVLSIGEAARLAGVSVQTLRHYHKLGLLVPSHVSTAGYRRYTARDCERLALIRALREVGFDLDTIAQVLDSGLEPDKAVRMRLEALEAEQRAVRRRQLLLRAAAKGNHDDVLGRLKQSHALAKLERLEREAFLQRHLGWAPRDTPASESVWSAATSHLPEEMDDAQLEAWLELAEVVADEGFRDALARQFDLGRELADSQTPGVTGPFSRLLAHVVATLRMRRDPDDEASRILLEAWLDEIARLRACAPDVELVRWLRDRFESVQDPRIDRYWELISKLKQVPYDPAYARAFEWVVDALGARVSRVDSDPVHS